VGKLHAVVFCFTIEGEAPTAYDVPLEEGSGRWNGTFSIPEGIVFGMVKVGDGVRYDMNGENFWSFNVHDAGGRVLQGAYMKASMSYLGMLPAECRRKQDIDEAREMLELEVKSHPRNLTATVNLVLLQMNAQEITQEEAQARLREIVGNTMQATSPMEAIALSQAYQIMGRQEESARIMQDAAVRFQKSKAEEQIRLEELSSAPNLDVFVDKVIKHLQAYPNTFAKQNLVDAVVNATTRGGNLEPLVRFMDETPALTPITYYQAVNYFGARDSLRPTAMRMIDQGLAAAKDDTRRPSYVSPMEWKEECRIASSLLWFVKGAIQRAQGQTNEALASFATAVELGGRQTDKGTYDMYVQTLAAAGQKDKAVEMATTAIKAGAATQGVMDTYRSLRRADGVDSSKVEAQMAKLIDEGRSVLVERLGKEMLNQMPIDGAFTTLDGKPLKLSDLKGKVVVLDYWATWCGPCVKSFPSLQRLYEKYRNNPKVAFAIVNVWERSEDRVGLVKGFLEKNSKLTFPVYLDKDDSVVSKYGVTGIPTKFYLGKDGRIQFKEVGYLPEEQFIEEATNKIEVLLAQ
jgi:thiol-disulfide isomerase/thioredoxin